jgi:hypothetical protein
MDGIPIICDLGYWESIELIKTKAFNPIMFECIEFETDDVSPGFGNDIFFEMIR